jgi:DNA-binding response OmpR family regulator
VTRILVIEDEPNLRKLIKTNFAASGYEVVTASDGEEGLNLAKEERPDLILLDIRMPGMSGWDVLIALKTNPKVKKVPVIIMTASAPEESEQYKMRSMRAAGYLVKPFGVDVMLSKVKETLTG